MLRRNHAVHQAGIAVLIATGLAVTVFLVLPRSSPFSRADILDTPTPARAGDISTPVSTAVRSSAFVTTPPGLAGKVVHWSISEMSFTEAGPDPANGKVVLGDIWAEIGPDSVPVRFHGIYLYEDGRFRQEIVLTPTEEVITYDPLMAVRTPSGEVHCTVRDRTGVGRLRTVAPPFIDVGRLRAFGYQSVSTGGARSAPPMLSPLPGVLPQQIYPADQVLQRWQRRQSAGGQSQTQTLELGPDGRLLLQQSRATNAQGKVVQEYSQGYGSLEVYAPESVPSSVFQLKREGCGE